MIIIYFSEDMEVIPKQEKAKWKYMFNTTKVIYFVSDFYYNIPATR